MKRIFLVAALIGAPGAAVADQDVLKHYALKYVDLIQSLQACLPVDGKEAEERLACFDGVILSFLDENQPPPPTREKWVLAEGTDDFTDAPQAIITTEEDGDGSSCFLGNQGKKRTLGAVCTGKAMGFVVDFQCWMQGESSATSKGTIDVEYRAGNSTPVTDLGHITGDGNHVVVFARGEDGTSLAKEMLGASRLVVRASGGTEGMQAVRFDLTGLSEAIKPLREACGW